MRSSRYRSVLGLLTAAAVLTLSACGGGGDGDAAGDSAGASSSTSDTPGADSSDSSGSDGADGADGPDLDGIPDVVAEVNGEEVTKEDFVPFYEASFQQAAMQAQASGEDPDEEALKKQAVDDLVDTELLAQEAESRGIEISDQDVDEELTALAGQNGMKSADELLKAVEEQGLTEDQARSQIETQLLIEQLVTDETGPIEPTEKELRALYEQARKQQEQSGQAGQEFPAFDKVRSQLVEQAKAQESGRVAETLVTDLREDAEITINL
jgi:peptidyl-prolyl cis-trans isomerase SurA